MTRDPELQALIDRAAKQRHDDAARVTDVASQPKAVIARPSAPQIAFSHFERVHPGGLGLSWLVGGLAGGLVVAIMAVAGHRTLAISAGVSVVAALGVRIAFRYAHMYRAFDELRAFPGHVSIEVTGWRELIATLVDDSCAWRLDCVLEVVPGDHADPPVLTAAADLFLADVNRWFYAADSVGGAASDLRAEWRRDGMVLFGSANVLVACEIYELIRLLDRIARSGGVRAVVIRSRGSVITVSRPSYTD
jgi:hypothetical protein